MRIRPAILFVLPLAMALACGGGDAAPGGRSGAPAPAVTSAAATPALRGNLAVFAAASLTDAFNEVGAEFKKANPGVDVTFNFAASTALRAQIEQGARADLFASADQVQMDNAKRAGMIQGEERLFAKNKLVVIHPTGNPGRVYAIQDLARPGVKLVLTDRNVPIGAYARTALEKMSADPQFGADFGQRVLANLRSEEGNARAVVTKVQLGEADAGVVYASDLTPAIAREVQRIAIPDQFNTVATYPIAVVRDAPHRAAAQAFVEFARSPQGQEILERHGFIVDAETGAR